MCNYAIYLFISDFKKKEIREKMETEALSASASTVDTVAAASAPPPPTNTTTTTTPQRAKMTITKNYSHHWHVMCQYVRAYLHHRGWELLIPENMSSRDWIAERSRTVEAASEGKDILKDCFPVQYRHTTRTTTTTTRTTADTEKKLPFVQHGLVVIAFHTEEAQDFCRGFDRLMAQHKQTDTYLQKISHLFFVSNSQQLRCCQSSIPPQNVHVIYGTAVHPCAHYNIPPPRRIFHESSAEAQKIKETKMIKSWSSAPRIIEGEDAFAIMHNLHAGDIVEMEEMPGFFTYYIVVQDSELSSTYLVDPESIASLYK